MYKSKDLSDKPNNNSKKTLNSYSLTGIGIGGIIGAGFFLGSGLAINQAGPSVILAFLLGGLIMSQVLGAMTSISINRPVQGSFRVYAEEFLGQYIGFLLGWVVFVSGILALSSEAVAAGIFLRYWFPQIPLALFALIVLLLVITANIFGAKNFGYIESGMSVVKIGVIIAFILLGGFFLFSHGIRLIPNPFLNMESFFPNSFLGFLQSMLIVIFTYSGISAVAMATAEVEDPRKDIPKATVLLSIGIVGLYILSMAVIVSIVSWSAINTEISPFVLVFNRLGFGYMSTAMNGVIFIAALSVMIATYFSCTQILVSLAEAQEAPKLLKLKTQKGFSRNAWFAVGIFALLVVALSFVLGTRLFNYLVSASSYFTFFNWIINLITYLTWLKHRRSTENFDSPLIWGREGIYGTLLGIIFLLIVSLGVTDYRMGFYVAIGILAVLTSFYKTLLHEK